MLQRDGGGYGREGTAQDMRHVDDVHGHHVWTTRGQHSADPERGRARGRGTRHTIRDGIASETEYRTIIKSQITSNMKLCSEMLLEVTVYCGKVRDQRGCLTATEHSL